MKKEKVISAIALSCVLTFSFSHAMAYETFDKHTGEIEQHSEKEVVPEDNSPVKQTSASKSSTEKEGKTHSYRVFDQDTGKIKDLNDGKDKDL